MLIKIVSLIQKLLTFYRGVGEGVFCFLAELHRRGLQKQTTQKSFFTILFTSVLLFIYNFPYFAALPPSSSDSLSCWTSQADRLSPSGSRVLLQLPPSSEQRRLRLEPLCCGGTGCRRTWWSRRGRAGLGGPSAGRTGSGPPPGGQGQATSWKTIAGRRITWAVRCDVLGYVQLFVLMNSLTVTGCYNKKNMFQDQKIKTSLGLFCRWYLWREEGAVQYPMVLGDDLLLVGDDPDTWSPGGPASTGCHGAPGQGW